MKRYLSLLIPALVALGVSAPAGAEGYFRFGIGTGGFACDFGYYDYWGEYCDDFRDPDYELDFYAYLEPYGRWVYVGRWGGYVWVPRVSIGWRPYTCGRWIWTSHGWTWLAYEPWGWVPHHYGYWVYDSFYGWVWVPGNVWVPHRVLWHHEPGWVGWAPMPPYWHRYYHWDGDRYRPRSRYKWKFPDYDSHVSRRSWVYVPERDFQERDLRSRFKEKSRADYEGRDFEILRDGPPREEMERLIGREIRPVEVEEVVRKSKQGEVRIVRPREEVARTPEAREAVERYVEPALDRRHREALRERHEALLAEREEREWKASRSRTTKEEEEKGQVSRSAYSSKRSEPERGSGPGEPTRSQESSRREEKAREERSRAEQPSRSEKSSQAEQPSRQEERTRSEERSRSQSRPVSQPQEEHRERSHFEQPSRSSEPSRERSRSDSGAQDRGNYNPSGSREGTRSRW